MRVRVTVDVEVEVGLGVSVGLNVQVGRGDNVGIGVYVTVDTEVGVWVSVSGKLVGACVADGEERKEMDRIKPRISIMPSKASTGINASRLDCLLSIF